MNVLNKFSIGKITLNLFLLLSKLYCSLNQEEMIEIDPKYKAVLLEALEELMYKNSLLLNDMKGGPMDKKRKRLTEKQEMLEKLQHEVSKEAD